MMASRSSEPPQKLEDHDKNFECCAEQQVHRERQADEGETDFDCDRQRAWRRLGIMRRRRPAIPPEVRGVEFGAIAVPS
jgi:hypothetical protein